MKGHTAQFKAIIDKLSIIKAAINDVPDDFCSNQIRCVTERACINNNICIDSMNKYELDTFQADLINTFKEKHWIVNIIASSV